MKYLIKIFLISLIILTSCDKVKVNNQNSNPHINYGKWTFIQINSKEKEYAEIEFKDNNSLRVRFENKGDLGPFYFQLDNNFLSFNNHIFEIITKSDTSFLLKDDKSEFILYKINFKEEDLNKNQIDPFYIRKCYFFVHLNFITTEKAIEYLKSIQVVDSIPEEIIFER